MCDKKDIRVGVLELSSLQLNLLRILGEKTKPPPQLTPFSSTLFRITSSAIHLFIVFTLFHFVMRFPLEHCFHVFALSFISFCFFYMDGKLKESAKTNLETVDHTV